MARFNVKVPDWCGRPVATQEALSRPFRMMHTNPDSDDSAGPGCYESSRELELGLLVCEAAMDDWHAAWAHRPAPALREVRGNVSASA